MKKLARLIIALFATQLLFAGIARASINTTAVDQHSSVCAMPVGEEPGDAF